jgi:hypothetical protein
MPAWPAVCLRTAKRTENDVGRAERGVQACWRSSFLGVEHVLGNVLGQNMVLLAAC